MELVALVNNTMANTMFGIDVIILLMVGTYFASMKKVTDHIQMVYFMLLLGGIIDCYSRIM